MSSSFTLAPSGMGHRSLAEGICGRLGLPLQPCQVSKFANQETGYVPHTHTHTHSLCAVTSPSQSPS